MILKDKTSYFEVSIFENSGLFDKMVDEKEPFWIQNTSLIKFPNSYLEKIFYLDGKIKTKGILNNLGFRVGKWYEFDSYGNLVKTEDTDIGYLFTFERLKKTLEEQGIHLEMYPDDPKIINVTYVRKLQKEKPLWEVSYPELYNTKDSDYWTYVTLYYDGATGELIKKEYEERLRPWNPGEIMAI